MKTETESKTTAQHGSARGGDKKLVAPVTLFAAVEAEQHAALRAIAFAEHRSLADVVREALTAYLMQHAQHPTQGFLIKNLAPFRFQLTVSTKPLVVVRW